MSSYWRHHYTLKPVRVLKEGKLESMKFKAWWLAKASRPPPAGWMKPGFDDAGWHRMPGWNPESPFIGLLCMRGKFIVSDPEKVAGLKLSLACEGGVAVYLNGREIARAHLPKAARPDTPAEMYEPVNARKPKRDARKLDRVAIDTKLLRKGVNVLAIELHRATYHASDFWLERRNITIEFGNCGLVKVRLTAAEAGGLRPNVTRPKGLGVWNSDVVASDFDVDFADPAETLRPVRIVAARNGAFSGKVVVGSRGPIKGLRAMVGDFVQKGGPGRIPASAAEVRYAHPGGEESEARYYHTVQPSRFDALEPTRPETVDVREKRRGRRSRKLPDEPKPVAGAVQPVWVTVNVPADARPGKYEGALTIRAEGAKPIRVPLALKVVGWTLPPPADFRTFVEMVQSPETLAIRYNVPAWSDPHYKLIARSLKLLGQVRSRVCIVPLICDTNLGNDYSMVRWIKQPEGTFKHDFSIFEKYLDLLVKHQGRPAVVCLFVWDTYLDGGRGGAEQWASAAVKAGRKGHEGKGPLVSLLDPATGKVEKLALPRYRDPESEHLWRPVFDGIRERLRKRGLTKAAMVGISTDNIPSKEVVAFFGKLCPDMPWANHSHPYRTKMRSSPVGYSSGIWRGGHFANRTEFERLYGWKRAELAVHFPRSTGDSFPQTNWRFMGEMNITGKQRGFARLGADFFGVLRTRPRRPMATLSARFPKSSWRNLDIRTCLLAPGANGPIATARFEMIREGLQACEARIFIEQALTDEALRAKLGEELAARCQRILDERLLAMLRGVSSLRGRSVWTRHAYASTGWWQAPAVVGSHWFAASDWQDRLEALYSAAGEVKRKLKAQ